MEWLQAAGVVLAIAISLATYVVTNKRDDNKWQRDALLEAMVRFLDGSFARYSEQAFGIRRGQWQSGALSDSGDFERYIVRAKSGHRQQNAALTRLRLLAPSEVVESAEDLAASDHNLEQWFDNPNDDHDSWESLNADRQARRAHFIQTYRSHFRLGKGKSIEAGWGPGY